MNQDAQFTDEVLEADLAELQTAVQLWATSHDLWFDCGFSTYQEQVDGEPSAIDPVVCVQHCTLEFENAINDNLYHEFSELLGRLGFWYENGSVGQIYYYPDDGPRKAAYANYFRWQWICGLVQMDFADIYQELYAHFAARPDDLYRLHWREYEILLARIFQTQGFEVELGPGSGDEGVDIRLLQRDPIGDILTLVQAKKYASLNKIGLETVQALAGAAFLEDANGVVITTSAFEPVANRWAARTSGRIDLRTSLDVAEWCRAAEGGIIRDKASLVAPSAVERLLFDLRHRPDRRLIHTSWGYNATHNDFAVVIKETKNAALLMRVPNQKIEDDGYGQRGTEVPLLDGSAIKNHHPDTVWRAKRKVGDDGSVSYWDGHRLFGAWNGKPAPFDYYD